jgi:hypothetical protein
VAVAAAALVATRAARAAWEAAHATAGMSGMSGTSEVATEVTHEAARGARPTPTLPITEAIRAEAAAALLAAVRAAKDLALARTPDHLVTSVLPPILSEAATEAEAKRRHEEEVERELRSRQRTARITTFGTKKDSRFSCPDCNWTFCRHGVQCHLKDVHKTTLRSIEIVVNQGPNRHAIMHLEDHPKLDQSAVSFNRVPVD